MAKPVPRVSPSSWPVYGHEWAVTYLRRVVASDRASTVGNSGGGANRSTLRHAYLFAGPPQVGKTTLSRAFAQALLCTAVEHEGRPVPCGICRSCRLMVKGQHPDIRFVQPVDSDGAIDRANGRLRVEQSEDLIRDAALRPMEGRYKIFLIQDAHTAVPAFSHKILKTLEEPPAHVVLFVTAVDRGRLLPTLVSRCEVMELRPLPVAITRDALTEAYQVEPERAELLARLSGGRMGWAVRQLESDEGTRRRLHILEELRNLVATNRVERLLFSEQTSANRDNLSLFAMLELWVTWWRDVLLVQNGCIAAVSNIDQQEHIERYARRLTVDAVQRHLVKLQRVEQYLHHTVNTRLALDALILDMPRIAD